MKERDDPYSIDGLVEDYANRVIQLERETEHLRTMIERIGKEKRTCMMESLRTPMVFVWVMGALLLVNLALAIYSIAYRGW